nr:hypothetical protein [Tanacetum cinerariifolium]
KWSKLRRKQREERESIWSTCPPNAPHDQIIQELDELLEISAMIDSRPENMDHDLIDVSPLASSKQLLPNFLDLPEYLEIDDIVLDTKSVDTQLVSPFLDQCDELDDGEILELALAINPETVSEIAFV